jgi:hypothetical protein
MTEIPLPTEKHLADRIKSAKLRIRSGIEIQECAQNVVGMADDLIAREGQLTWPGPAGAMSEFLRSEEETKGVEADRAFCVDAAKEMKDALDRFIEELESRDTTKSLIRLARIDARVATETANYAIDRVISGDEDENEAVKAALDAARAWNNVAGELMNSQGKR